MLKAIINLALQIAIFQSVVVQGHVADVDRTGVFSGRITHLDKGSQEIHVHVDFVNAKFIRTGDRVKLWHHNQYSQKCEAKVTGKNNHKLYLKPISYDSCQNRVGFSKGTHLYFSSEDLEFHLKQAREMVALLMKKRLILQSQLELKRKQMGDVDNEISSIHGKYDEEVAVIERRRQQDLAGPSELRVQIFEQLREDEQTIGDIDFKLERYRVESENLAFDRWSLDPMKHFVK